MTNLTMHCCRDHRNKETWFARNGTPKTQIKECIATQIEPFSTLDQEANPEILPNKQISKLEAKQIGFPKNT